MTDPLFLALPLGILIGVAQYFSEEFADACTPYLPHILSFSGGISVTYIFLQLFPEFTKDIDQSTQLSYLAILLGFVVFHLIEQYVYQYAPGSTVRKTLNIENHLIFFIYHFILGMLLYTFAQQGFTKASLFFGPMLLYTALSTLPAHPPESQKMKFITSLATLVGIIFSAMIYPDITPSIRTTLIGFIIGALAFTVLRHSIPHGKEGRPHFFILGILFYTPFILLTWCL